MLPRNSAKGAVADVTLDNEGPETNHGGSNKYMRVRERWQNRSFSETGESTTDTCHQWSLSTVTTSCARDQ
jgi:hypothetical protein